VAGDDRVGVISFKTGREIARTGVVLRAAPR
jgi:hypothetical protein